jgi:hypothetical protein
MQAALQIAAGPSGWTIPWRGDFRALGTKKAVAAKPDSEPLFSRIYKAPAS